MKRARLFGLVLSTLAASMLPLLVRPATQFEYAKMAPLSQYTMDRSAEISLAQTAAPAAISRDATVLVLASQGYVVGNKGTNGFLSLIHI